MHRDVSPENILVTYSGQVKVVDFGIAKAAHLESQDAHRADQGQDQLHVPGAALGQGRSIAARTSGRWASRSHWLLHRRRSPSAAKSEAEVIQQILNAEPPPLRKLIPAGPAELERIVQKALAKDPDRRYADGAGLQEDLEDWLATTTPKITSGSLADRMNALFPPKRDADRLLKNAILAGQLPKPKRKKQRAPTDLVVDLGVPDFSAQLASQQMSDLDIVEDEPLVPGPTSLDVELKEERSLWLRGTRALLRGTLLFLLGGALGLLVWQTVAHQAELEIAGAWLIDTSIDLANPGGAERHLPFLAGSTGVSPAAVAAAFWLRRRRRDVPTPGKHRKSK